MQQIYCAFTFDLWTRFMINAWSEHVPCVQLASYRYLLARLHGICYLKVAIL